MDDLLKLNLANARFPGPILVQGRGGAGNQLFQYAAALALAKQLENPQIFWIPTDAPRRTTGFCIEDFIGPLPRARACDLARFLMPPCCTPPSIKRTNRALRRELHIGRSIWREQRSNRVQTIEIPYVGKGLLINAFCQSLKWVEPALPEVSDKILKLRPTTARTAKDITAVHFRLGDFRRRGWTLPADYYFRSLEILDADRRSKLWIITDATEEQEKLAAMFSEKGWRVEETPKHDCRPELVRFWNLCTAEKLVLSCSTFAWWAAVVGDSLHASEDRSVAFPDPWLPLYNDNLCRQQWVKVPHSGLGL